jgi:hypothetical protein
MTTWYIVSSVMLIFILFGLVRNFPDVWRYFKIKSM